MVLIWRTHKNLNTECENTILYFPMAPENSILLTKLVLQMMFYFIVKLIEMFFPFSQI